MKRFFTSRGMGKTTQLLNLALSSGRTGNKVVFIIPNAQGIQYVKGLISDEEQKNITFTTLRDYLRDYPAYSGCQIFIDELDECLKAVLPQLQAYTLTIGD